MWLSGKPVRELRQVGSALSFDTYEAAQQLSSFWLVLSQVKAQLAELHQV